jgi:hypothetical protein
MATAREAAFGHLHRQLESVARFRADYKDEGWPEGDGRIAGTVGALRAVGLLSEEEAEAWRARLSEWGEERPTAPPSARETGEDLLGELLDAVAPGDGAGVELGRFQGALGALGAVGAAEAGWDERLRRRMGWPSEAELRELNRGGTQTELVAVLAGPPAASGRVRVAYALRFSDGISFLIRRQGDTRVPDEGDLWDADLIDDLGTRYAPSGGGGGAAEVWLSFRTAPPAEATWVELRGAASEPIRIDL